MHAAFLKPNRQYVVCLPLALALLLPIYLSILFASFFIHPSFQILAVSFPAAAAPLSLLIDDLKDEPGFWDSVAEGAAAQIAIVAVVIIERRKVI